MVDQKVLAVGHRDRKPRASTMTAAAGTLQGPGCHQVDDFTARLERAVEEYLRGHAPALFFVIVVEA